MRRLSQLAGALLALLVPAVAHAQAQAGPFGGCKNPPRVSQTGAAETNPKTDTGKISGSVEIECDDLQLFADVVEWDQTTVRATGQITFVQQSQGLTVYADRMEMNRATHFGTFFNARGFARLSPQTNTGASFGRQEPDIQFKGERFERTGPETYKLTNGSFSTCEQPTPRWYMTGSKGTVVLDKHFILKNAVLKVKDVPLLYLPYIYYPLSKENRSTGFLMPSYSASSNLGSGFSNAFFLVLGRSQDATFYHTWASKAGQTFGTEYEYAAAPGSDGRALFKVINSKQTLGAGDAVVQQATTSYDVEGWVNQGLPHGFRLISHVNYFTSIQDQQRYEQNVYDASNRSRDFGGQISGTFKRWYRFSGSLWQRDYFSTTTQGITSTGTRQGRAPQVDFQSVDRPIGKSRIYAGVGSQAAYLIQQDDIETPEFNHSLFRIDATPRIRAPLSKLPYLSATAAASYRFTYWTEQLDPETSQNVPQFITRNVLTFSGDLVGPVLTKVWSASPTNGYAERFKHVIEPRFGLQWISPFEQRTLIVPIEYGIDSMVTGTTNISYSLTNRLLARRKMPVGPSVVRDVMSVTIAQSHYSDSLAAQYDPSYLLGGASPYSALSISATATPTDTLSGTLQTYFDPKFKKPQSFTASGSILKSLTRVTASWSKTQYIVGSPIYIQAAAAHFLGTTVTVRNRNGHLNGTYAMNFDIKHTDFIQQRIVATYTAQCCGITFDYQSYLRPQYGQLATSPERRFGVSFSLAGIGSFSNPFGSFGDNIGRR